MSRNNCANWQWLGANVGVGSVVDVADVGVRPMRRRQPFQQLRPQTIGHGETDLDACGDVLDLAPVDRVGRRPGRWF
jgi:hypothetical protein